MRVAKVGWEGLGRFLEFFVEFLEYLFASLFLILVLCCLPFGPVSVSSRLVFFFLSCLLPAWSPLFLCVVFLSPWHPFMFFIIWFGCIILPYLSSSFSPLLLLRFPFLLILVPGVVLKSISCQFVCLFACWFVCLFVCLFVC